MPEIVVAFAPEDSARGEAVTQALRDAGRTVRASPGSATDATLILWSRHAARRKLSSKTRRPLIARLDDAPPPMGARAYAAADLRAWRGKPDQPAFRALLKKLDWTPAVDPGRARAEAAAERAVPRRLAPWGLLVALALMGGGVYYAGRIVGYWG